MCNKEIKVGERKRKKTYALLHRKTEKTREKRPTVKTIIDQGKHPQQSKNNKTTSRLHGPERPPMQSRKQTNLRNENLGTKSEKEHPEDIE